MTLTLLPDTRENRPYRLKSRDLRLSLRDLKAMIETTSNQYDGAAVMISVNGQFYHLTATTEISPNDGDDSVFMLFAEERL